MPHVDLTIDGIRYPSVTEILGDKPKPWLITWREKWGVLADRKTKAATNVGKRFHRRAERLAKGLFVRLPKDRRLARMLEVFDSWVVSSGLKVKETELHVVSAAYKYQGTFDATGYLSDRPKELCLFDWKTSSAIYPEYAEQLVAYAQAYFEQTGIWIKSGIILHVSKDKPRHKVTVKEYRLNKRLLNKFLKRVREYHQVRVVTEVKQ